MPNRERRHRARRINVIRGRRNVSKKKRAEIRRRSAKRHRLITQKISRKRQPKPEKVTLVVPAVFCFLSNPREVNKFIALIRLHIGLRHTIFLNFQEVETLGSGAIIMLLAHSKDPKLNGRSLITGNMPRKYQAAQVLKQSGFFDHVYSAQRASECMGRIQRRKGKRVDASVIKEMINFGSQKLFGEEQKMKGVYRIYVEAMANTRDHASGTEGEIERWWTAAYYDELEKKVVFTLIDIGVGIFKSAKLRFFQDSALVAIGFRNRADVLASIMDGDIGSRTGIPFRGKGLPAMKRVFDRKQISNLVVAANDAMIDFNSGEKTILDPPVHGTVLTWEYDANCL